MGAVLMKDTLRTVLAVAVLVGVAVLAVQALGFVGQIVSAAIGAVVLVLALRIGLAPLTAEVRRLADAAERKRL